MKASKSCQLPIVIGLSLSVFSCTSENSLTPAPSASTPAGMRHIIGGSFQMGQTALDGIATPTHIVTVSAFYIDTTLVTQEAYQAVMDTNPSHFVGDPSRPVEEVSWYAAVRYCIRKSVLAGLQSCYDTTDPANWTCNPSRNGYRLPTEAEYEYACRAGDTSSYFWGNDTDVAMNYAWFSSNNNDSTQRVATKLPNAWGLYDMVGNVWEWCNDWFDVYTAGTTTDPAGPASKPANGFGRVLRGGTWSSYPDNIILSSAFRDYFDPLHWSSLGGFRCVRR